jgi:hypothetical protein
MSSCKANKQSKMVSVAGHGSQVETTNTPGAIPTKTK